MAHGDRAVDRGPEAAARDLADPAIVLVSNLGVSAHRRASLRPDPDQAAGRAFLQLAQDRLSADEAALVAPALADRPDEGCFDRRRRLIDVVAVEAQPRLEAQG